MISRVAAGLALALVFPQTPAAALRGTWHGTSICVDRRVDRACQDEEVVYEFDSAPSPRGPVRMSADKIVSGVRQPMGVLRLEFDSRTQLWSAELTARLHGRWSFAVRGEVLEGTLTELPSGRLVRRATARRAPTSGNGPPH